MSSPYWNRIVDDAMLPITRLDRYSHTAQGRLSRVVTVAQLTRHDGRICWVLSIYETTDERDLIATHTLGSYCELDPAKAISDGRVIAQRFGLSLRIASHSVGWRFDLSGVAPIGDVSANLR